MNLPILTRIDEAIRAHERAGSAVTVPCSCSWCRRQGLTRAIPRLPDPPPLLENTRWWRLRRR